MRKLLRDPITLLMMFMVGLLSVACQPEPPVRSKLQHRPQRLLLFLLRIADSPRVSSNLCGQFTGG